MLFPDELEYRARVTAVLRKMSQRWMITQEHGSVPFASVEAMQAALASATESP